MTPLHTASGVVVVVVLAVVVVVVTVVVVDAVVLEKSAGSYVSMLNLTFQS